MAISAIMSYTTAYPQVDLEYEEIKKKLYALGLIPSGSKSADKTKLIGAEKERELEKAQAASQSQKANSASGTNGASQAQQEEFSQILTYLGIIASDKPDYDYKQAVKKIDSYIQNATDPSERKYYLTMKRSLDTAIMAMGYTTQALSAGNMTGATALGDMNKQMLVSSGGFSSSGK